MTWFRRRTPLALVWASCLALAGCTVDESKNDGQRCGISSDCSTGLVCYRDFCVPGPAVPDGLQTNDGPATTGQKDAATPRATDAATSLEPQADAGEPKTSPSLDAPEPTGPDATAGAGEPVDASVPVADGAMPAGTLPGCSREALRERADACVAAMASGDTSLLRKHPSLRYTEADPWVEPVPAAARTPRAALNQLVASYFDSVSTRSLLPPYAPRLSAPPRRRADGPAGQLRRAAGRPTLHREASLGRR